MATPEIMPILAAGAHDGPEQGACVMEYVSHIVGEAWTDTPLCTPLSLAHLAQFTNDVQWSDKKRTERMLPLIPRLAGRGRDWIFDSHLGRLLYQKGLTSKEPLLADAFGIPPQRGGTTHTSALASMNMKGLVIHIFDPYANPSKMFDLLVECLDEYDHWLKRDTPTFTEEQTAGVQHLAALIGG